jgi:hypothetical protein
VGEERTPIGQAADVCRRLRLEADQRDLVAALLDLGVSVEAMEHAQARGSLADAIFDMVLDPERVRVDGDRQPQAARIERGG